MRYIIGMDEVGRGPLAGPVTVAAVAVPRELRIKNYELGMPLRDSKRLTEKQREEWFEYIKSQKLWYAVASVYPRTIDRLNISRAANLAATRAIKKLLTSYSINFTSCQAYLDGGLYLNAIRNKKYEVRTRTVIRGDEKYNSIKLASIIAKVRRDRLMKRYHKKYPQYAFYIHKGYGTKAHFTSIKRHGPCRLHRLTFLTKLVSMKSEARNPKF